jgi:ABC-2 type transport system ATP-binding protein
MHKIELSGLSKHYRAVAAVDDVNLTVDAGEILVLLGRNGAGKTTTLRLMMGFLRPTRGSVRFDGEPLSPERLERISFVAESSNFYETMKVSDHLEWYRRSYKHFNDARAKELVQTFSIDVRKGIRQLSKGQRTAFALVLAFSIDPEILLLDEPTSGLDLVHQQTFRELLIGASARGAAIVLSSHHVRTFEGVADRVAILENGRLKVSGSVDDLKAQFRSIDLVLHAPESEAQIDADDRTLWTRRDDRLIRITTRSVGDAFERDLAALGNVVRVQHFNLEEIFMETVGQHELH